jgi:hypothetical protein
MIGQEVTLLKQPPRGREVCTLVYAQRRFPRTSPHAKKSPRFGKKWKSFKSGGMIHYSVYVIGVDGRISRRIDLQCANDDDAKARALLIAAQHQTVELWQEARMIAEFKRPH